MKWIDTLIKLRKDSVDSIERELVKVQANLNAQETILKSLIGDFQSIVMPTQSTGAVLKQFSIQREYATQAIKAQEIYVQNLIVVVQDYQNRLLEANKELEQAKYIKADYVKKELFKAKQKEQKVIDELASQRFYENNKENKIDV